MWPSGLERRFYDGHDRKVNGSTLTQASFLRPWIRCFTTIIFAWRNLSKLKKSEAKFKRKTRKQGKLLSESGFVLCIAPQSLSRDRRIKTKKSKKLSDFTLTPSDYLSQFVGYCKNFRNVNYTSHLPIYR